ncbi:MAG: GNAT family N-acetyltransferase [Thermodesulfobacteriota bacterium]|nr:GNAT family N-acetyltransferase [Thermodesulfobacteriota bacterium]
MTELTLNIPGVKVFRLHEKHIDEVIELMNKEGWYYYDHHELKRYLNLNQDCFTILKDGCIVGSVFTTNYGNQAWIGNIVVAKEARGMGLAAKLIRRVIDYLHENKHVLTFRLGAVPLAIGLYKKVGFHAEAFTTAQEAELPLKSEYEEINLGKNIQIESLDTLNLEAISEIDRQYFKSKRLQFLMNIYNDSIKESCFCLKDQGKIVGFLMLRRRQTSRNEGHFAEGPDYAYRLGPSCVLPEYGINGFKALFQKAILAVNKEVHQLGGSAKIYAVFPRNADKENIYQDTRELAKAIGMNTNIKLNRVFDEHDFIFGAQKSKKNEEQWKYMENLGFHQEYFEQVMSYTPGEALNTQASKRKAEETRADTEGIFASATPGDKA